VRDGVAVSAFVGAGVGLMATVEYSRNPSTLVLRSPTPVTSPAMRCEKSNSDLRRPSIDTSKPVDDLWMTIEKATPGLSGKPPAVCASPHV